MALLLFQLEEALLKEIQQTQYVSSILMMIRLKESVSIFSFVVAPVHPLATLIIVATINRSFEVMISPVFGRKRRPFKRVFFLKKMITKEWFFVGLRTKKKPLCIKGYKREKFLRFSDH